MGDAAAHAKGRAHCQAKNRRNSLQWHCRWPTETCLTYSHVFRVRSLPALPHHLWIHRNSKKQGCRPPWNGQAPVAVTQVRLTLLQPDLLCDVLGCLLIRGRSELDRMRVPPVHSMHAANSPVWIDGHGIYKHWNLPALQRREGPGHKFTLSSLCPEGLCANLATRKIHGAQKVLWTFISTCRFDSFPSSLATPALTCCLPHWFAVHWSAGTEGQESSSKNSFKCTEKIASSAVEQNLSLNTTKLEEKDRRSNLWIFFHHAPKPFEILQGTIPPIGWLVLKTPTNWTHLKLGLNLPKRQTSQHFISTEAAEWRLDQGPEAAIGENAQLHALTFNRWWGRWHLWSVSK